MNNFKVSSRLYILLGIAATAFSILLLVSELGLRYLGELQDSGHKRNMESAEMQVSAKLGAVMYQVIADSIINRNLAESAKDWAAIKVEAEKTLDRAKEVADTPEEKQEVEKAHVAYRELIRIYEGSVIPLLNANADLNEIRVFDDAMDTQAQAIENVLARYAKSLSAEAIEADEQFDKARHRIISTSLLAAVAMLGLMIAISIYISRSIIQQLGGEPGYAMEISRRIAAGDLTSRIEVEKAHGSSLMASMKVMQDQLAQLIQRINASASHVSSSAEQLAAASHQVSASSVQQSQDTASVAAAIEELTVSIDQVAGNAYEAEQIATNSGQRSDQGALQVKDATDEMARIAQSVNETATQMASLAEQSQQIASIANVIKEVADQTNLLALNAAIEAARAGEYGRGFAVVADEVRKLAERTTASAQEISTMTSNIQEHSDKAMVTMRQGNERVAEGVTIAQRAGDSMHHISEGSKGVVNAVTEISNALKEQKSASSEIAQKVENIAQMTEENTTAVSQVASTASQLKSMADDLMQAVSGFKV